MLQWNTCSGSTALEYEELFVELVMDYQCAPEWFSFTGLDPPYPVTREDLICAYIPSYAIFRSDQIQFHKNSTFVIVKFVCLVNMTSLLLGFLGYSVTKVDNSVVVKKKSRFRFWIASDSQRVSLCFSSLYISFIL